MLLGNYKHFITRIIQNDVDELTHLIFSRYGRGTFPGPALQLKTQKNKITINASFLYEDFIGAFLAYFLPSGEQFKLTGNIFSYRDLSSALSSIISSVSMKKSKNLYKATLQLELPSEKIKKLYSLLGGKCYILVSIKPVQGTLPKLQIKKSIPKLTDQIVELKTDFCKATLPNNEEILKVFIEEALPDFQEKIKMSFKSLDLKNQLVVTDIILPENWRSMPSREVRLKSKRKGKIVRTLTVDGETLKTEHDFLV